MSTDTHCVEHRVLTKQDAKLIGGCELCSNERVICPGCSEGLLEELQTNECGFTMRCPVCVDYGAALQDKEFADSNPNKQAKLDREIVIINCLRAKFPEEDLWKTAMNCESDSDSDSEDSRTECEYTGCPKLTDNETELCDEHNHPCRECQCNGAELYQSHYYCEGCLLEVKRAPTPFPEAKKKLEFKVEKRKLPLEELSNKRPKTDQQQYEEKAKRLQIQLYPPNQQGDPQIRPVNGRFKSSKKTLQELDEWEKEINRAVQSLTYANHEEDQKFILRHLMSRASYLAKKKKNC